MKGNIMIEENRWSWGQQLQWGILLFIAYLFLSFFFFDTTIYFKSIFNMVFSLITLTIFKISVGRSRLLTRKMKFTKPVITWVSICLFTLVLDMAIYNIPKNIYVVFTSRYFWQNTAYALSAAILEETIFRGFLLSAFTTIGVYNGTKFNLTKSAIYCSLLFGSFHLINLLSGSANIVLQQTFSAFGIGMLFSVIRITTNSLRWPILIHFILDWGPLVSYSYSGNGNWTVTFILFTLVVLSSVKTLYLFDCQISEYASQ